MKHKVLCVCAALVCATAASAQTKHTFSGVCSKPDSQQSVPAGDKDGHMFTISSGKCTSKGAVNGVESKDGAWADHGDSMGTKGKVSGMFVQNLDGGDKVFYSYSESVTMKDNMPQTASVSYTITGGTGKMKGLKGSGTCKLNAEGTDGSMKYSCTGVSMSK